MKKKVFLFIFLLSLVCMLNAQDVILETNGDEIKAKPFEGTIRTVLSTDFDQQTAGINKLADAKTGNKLADAIVKKSMNEVLGGINEAFSTINGQFEYLTKVKGNKWVQLNTQDGSITLFDCDKGEVFLTYPFAKAALKYTVAEYQQITLAVKFDIEILQDSIRELGGYPCKKVIASGKMGGKETNYSEYWYTDKITLPKCYLETFLRPGLLIVEETKIMVMGGNNTMYALVTEIDETEVSDDNFIIPKDCEIFTPKDYLKFTKKLNDAVKNKKTYTVGSKIPDTFWDF